MPAQPARVIVGPPVHEQPTTLALSNMQAAARVMAKLAIDGFLPPRQLINAAHAVRVPVLLIDEAIGIIHRNGYQTPAERIATRTIVTDPQGAAVPTKTAAKARRPDTFPDGTKTRRCARCAETKPIGDFRYVGKGRKANGCETFAFQSWCKSCYRDYQRERYVSAAREAALASVGLVLDGAETICVVCERPIGPDEGATVELHCHAACLTPPQA